MIGMEKKSVLISIQPYYVFLIIARLMGWNIPQEKTEEVRKDFPKDPAWDKRVHIYCSKNRKSFNRIPAQYQPFMEKLLGKVVGNFECDSIRKGGADNTLQAYYHNNPAETCLTDQELVLYANFGKPLYFWHISDLKVYDVPKDLGEFRKTFICKKNENCGECENGIGKISNSDCKFSYPITTVPQSWCYVEEL